MKSETLRCECTDIEHDVVITRSHNDDYPPDLLINVQLCRFRSLWSRTIAALKYVFNIHSEYHWDCSMIDLESAKKLKVIVDEYIQELESWKKK